MPISTAIQDLAGPVFLRPFQEDRLWRSYCVDYSGMFPGYGQKIMIPTDAGADPDATGATSYVPVDNASKVVPGGTVANLAWGNPTGVDLSVTPLEINRERDIYKIVDHLAERRVRPSLIASAAEWSALRILEAINDDIRAVFYADPNIPTVETLPAIPHAQFEAGSGAAWAAFENGVMNAFPKAKLAADVARWPRDGRVAVTSPRMYNILAQKLRDEKLFLVQGANEQFALQGEVLMWSGWEIVSDNSVGDGTGADDDGLHSIAFLRRGIGMGYAGELAMMDMFRSTLHKGIALQALYTWGAAVLEPKELRKTLVSLT